MRTSIYLLLLGLTVVGCEMPPAAPPADTPTVARVTETPADTPVVVAFPTAVPSPVTTPTASAPSGPRALPVLPVVQLASPAQNAQISVNQSFNVVVLASAENGVARIEVTDDGAPLRVENPSTPVPALAAIVNWTPNQIGTHVVRAVAYDAQNRASAPDEVTVTVIQNARKPTSIIVHPIGVPQVEFGTVLQIYGVATDEVGVTQIELWVDNQIYTYLTTPTLLGQPTFPFGFQWHALTPGTRTFFVRAYDNQNQTTDSALLKILVVDNQIPSLSVTFDRTNAPTNEPITITVSALNAGGIQKIELLSGKEIFSTLTSPNPARQTWLTTQVAWQNPNPGDYSISVRVYNASGNVKESPPQIVSILRPGQATPTPVPAVTPTRTRAPRATTTPRIQPPPPPRAEIISPADRFNSPSPLRVTFSGQGNAELERIELWGYYPGQAIPQIVCTIDAHATTQKTGQCDWTPPVAGIVMLYAQSIDIYRQLGKSPGIVGFIGVPVMPTATPTPLTFTARWNAATSAGPMTVTFRQTGATLRGDFRMAGVETNGRITSGTTRGDRLSFSVDFSAEGATPAAGVLTMDFDCMTDLNAGTMSCTFRDSRGRSGAALFRRETNP